MLKKLLVMGIALLGAFSVISVMNQDLLAAGNVYQAGGNVTGRINQLPSNLSASNNANIGLQKGDKVFIGVNNPLDGAGLGWQLLYYDQNYSTYDLGITGTDTKVVVNPIVNGTASAWYAMSTKPINNAHVEYPILPSKFERHGTPEDLFSYDVYMDVRNLNSNIQNIKALDTSNVPVGMFKPYDFTFLVNFLNQPNADTDKALVTYNHQRVEVRRVMEFINGQDIFMPEIRSMQSSSKTSTVATPAGGYHLSAADSSFSSTYYAYLFGMKRVNSANQESSAILNTSGEFENATFSTKSVTRPATMINLDHVIFASSLGTSTGYATVTHPILPNTYTNIYNATSSYKDMKLRIEDTNLTSTTSLLDIEGLNGASNVKFGNNSIAYLNASAIANANSEGINTVSAIIFDINGNFKYYKPLEAAKGTGRYALDLTGIPLGKYQVGIVNEVYNEASTIPAASSKITDVLPLEIVNSLSDLNYTEVHGKNVNDYYVTTDQGNVKSSNKVASLTTKNGVGGATVNGVYENGIIYKLQPSSDSAHTSDYQSFTIPTESGSDRPVLDATDQKPYVIANPSTNNYLSSGVYKYRVQAYDANGDPVAYESSDITKTNPFAKRNDGTIVKGITPSQGLITDDISIVVYPHSSQLTYAQLKDSNNEYYKKDDINQSGFASHLGTLTFANDANMQALFDEGYTINTTSSKLMKKGSTTEQINALKITGDVSDKSKFYIDKKSNVESGTYEFDAWLYFKNNQGDTALMKLSNQSLYIAPSLNYLNPDKPTEILGNSTFVRKYDGYASTANTENIFALISTDKADLATNSAIKYCIYDDVSKACSGVNDTNVLTLVDNGNGTASITAKPYDKTDSDVMIRSYIEDASHNILTYQDITIQIDRSERKMKWEGKKIGSLGKDVTYTNSTYELKLPYDSANTVEYRFSRILKTDPAIADGILALRHDDGMGAMGVTYNGKLTKGSNDDTFKLTDKCIGTSCYIEVTKAQDDFYEAGSVKLYIVSEDMQEIDNSKIEWQYDDSGSWQVAGNPLTLNYKETGIYPLKINTAKLPSDIKNVKITYAVEDPQNAKTISVNNKVGSDTEAEITILQANQNSDNASIKAVITSDNYASKTVMLPTRVNKLQQTIAFNNVFENLDTDIKLDPSASYFYEAEIKAGASLAGKGTIAYTISGNPVGMVNDNSANKTVSVDKVGVMTITATLTDDKNYTSTSKTITKTITFYDDAGIIWNQDALHPEAINTIDGVSTGDANNSKEIGTISIDGGKSDAYTFRVDNTKHSDDSTFFDVTINADQKSGKLTIMKPIDAAALHSHATQIGTSDDYEWVIHVLATSTSDASEIAKADIKLVFNGAQPDILFERAVNKTITDSYDTTKSIDLNVKRGAVRVSSPTLTITGFTSALSLNGDGVSALIKGANTDNNDVVRSGRKVEVSADVEASAGYKKGTSSKQEIIIKKAAHPNIDFKTKTLSSSNNVDVDIIGILNGSGKANEDVTMTPIRGEASDAWRIDPFEMSKGEAYTAPKLFMSPKGYLGTIDFTITASGDDNYKPLPSDAITTIEFTEDGGIIYKPMNITYGDKSKHVLDFIVSPDPASDASTVTYAYSGFDTDIVTIDANGAITPVKVGTTTLTFKRMDSADNSEMEQNIKVSIKPKDVNIYVNDLNKKVGEVVVSNDFTIDTGRSTAFETGDDVGTFAYSCQDNNVEVTTLTSGLQGPAPKTLPINVAHLGGNAIAKANYTITYHPGNLNITQDASLESWISVVPKGSTILKDKWYNGEVEVKVNAIAGNYSEISSDGNAPWGSSFTVSEEGKNIQDVYFRDPITQAKTIKLSKEIFIDATAPRVEKITAKASNNKLEDILNSLTFGIYFKPGTQFTIATTDQADTKTIVNEVSGTTSLIYSIYKIENDLSETVIVKDQLLPIKDEVGKIKISDNSGTYKICTSASDAVGNVGTQSCASVKIGYQDMNIPTGDNNCPDVNLDFNDDGVAELNVDLNGDQIPDLNIDHDYDGFADMNVDSDEDGKPDLNLVNLEDWKPGACVVVDEHTYATMENLKPDLNVVIDNGVDEIKNQKPLLNIDTDGDLKADFNISFDALEPYLNIGKIPAKWMPAKDYMVQGFSYDTMSDLEPLTNMGIIDDKYPSINIDLNKDGKPELNIDINGDGIPDLNLDGDGDGSADINIDKDNNGTPDEKVMRVETWNPKKMVNDKITYITMELKYEEKGDNILSDNGITIEKPNGSFLPNYSLKVNDVTNAMKEALKQKIPNEYKNKTLASIYNVQLFAGDRKTQPDGTIVVRIPAKAGLRNPILMVETKEGSYEMITPQVVKGYYIYETDFLGNVSVLGDIDEAGDPDVILPTPDDDTGGTLQSPSVKGTYVSAGTGDEHQLWFYMILCLTTSYALIILYRKKHKIKDR